MAPKQDSVEGIVLQYVNEQNRPLNAQNVSDSLQKHGIKKALVQKVLDTLAADAKISFKEYGKQKVYLANQAQFEIPNLDELDEMKKQNDGLQAHVSALRACVTTLEAEVRSTETSLTLDQIREKAKKLNVEISEMETKLGVLRQGTVLVAPEERKQVEEAYNLKLGMWRKRKNMFRDLWATITEAMTEDSKQLKEELSIEFDEDVGINIADYSNLGIKKLKKGYPTSK
ncbi:unnamed protein product [Sphagnum jensenii]|uniref:Homologous-pairing protein 2 homolog n=1 Tax=Sphagnum jensenii TaxID=128206 RepID=A0ABP0XKR1_9BRYO